jgi:hypothetical protein
MRAWIGFSLAVAMATVCEARAADWYTGVPGDGPSSPRVAIDVAIDGTSKRALSGVLIGTIAPFAPLDQSGVRLRVGGLGGAYNYIPSTPGLGRVHGAMEGGSFMAGYEWVAERATIAVFGGAEITNTSLSPNDPNNVVKGLRGGLKFGVDFYVTPTDFTMISGVAYYSTNFNAYYGRLKFGMAIANHVYVGPEALALGDDFFQQWRMGGHVTGLRLGILQMGASAGFLNDRVRGAGAYGILDSRIAF